MNTFNIKNIFKASNCNSSYKILKWINNTNYIIYGSGNNINFVDTEKKKIIYTFINFEGNIKQIEINILDDIVYIFIITNTGELGVLMVNNLYNYKNFDEKNICFKKTLTLNNSLISISSIVLNNEFLLSFSDSNGKIYLYKYSLNEDKLYQIDSYLFGNNLVNDIKFSRFKENIYLFIALSDFKLHIYKYNSGYENVDENKCLIYLSSAYGHSNKIISIETFNNTNNELEIITGSVDNSIRIWRIKENNENINFENNKNYLKLNDNNIFYLYSVLNGHLDSLTYCKIIEINNSKMIFSSSLDYTIQIWEKEEKSDLYISNTKLGEFAGNKNSFIGFDVIKNSNNQYNLIGYTVFGSFFNWKIWDNKNSNNLDRFNFEYTSFVSGHFSKVSDICWSSCGNFLISTSKDQTTRVWTNIENSNINNKGFYEVSRPQIHGYDINSICNFPLKNTSDDRKFCDLIICGADEKILRILEPNAYFVNNINYYKNKDIHLYFDDINKENEIIESRNPLQYTVNTHVGGNVLGLLVKAVESDKKNFYFDDGKKLIKNEIGKIDFNKNENPTEDFLNQLSLWPENNKLFGHGNQISIIRSSFKGKYLASTCLSKNNKIFGSIIIWDPINLKITHKLESHLYTILDLCFSYDEKYLVSVSRDRQLSIFEFKNDKFEEIHKSYPHKKMIQGIAITDNNSKLFTCSRDKLVKSYKFENSDIKDHSELDLEENLTSICYIDNIDGIDYILVGTDNGNIIYLKNDNKFEIIWKKKIHGKKINQVKLNIRRKLEERVYEVGVCSDDFSISIFNINN